ncbi:MAG: YceI family protein [Pseudomonadota bacterium]
MKKLKLLTAAILSLIIISKISLADNVSNKYKTEANHTSVTWTANHFGFSSVSGKFTDIDGIVIFNEKKPEQSSVEVVIKTNILETGIAKLDTHLKSADFFNVEKFPTATFISKKITMVGKDKAKIAGNLTLMGITKPIILDVVFNKSGINPVNQKSSIGFTASASLNRSDFGIKYALPGVADKIDLLIQLEANQ